MLFACVRWRDYVFVYLDCHCTLPSSSFYPDHAYNMLDADGGGKLPEEITPNINSRTIHGCMCDNSWENISPLVLNFTYDGKLDIVASKVTADKWIKVSGFYKLTQD